MAALDHFIFSSVDLAAGVDLIAGTTGVTAAPGGPHPGVGTHNALLTFDDETYLEIIAIDPSQPEPGRTRPFRLDERLEPRLAGFAIHPTEGDSIDSLAALMREGGFDPGAVMPMSRKHPDGHMVEWRLTYGGEPEPPASACLPFVIDWGSTPTPALSSPKVGDLVEVSVAHPDPAVRSVAEALDVGLVVSAGPAELSIRIATPNGEVVLSSA